MWLKHEEKIGHSSDQKHFLELLAGCVNCIEMFSLTLKYDSDSIKYKVCMEMRNRYYFSNVNRKICDPS